LADKVVRPTKRAVNSEWMRKVYSISYARRGVSVANLLHVIGDKVIPDWSLTLEEALRLDYD